MNNRLNKGCIFEDRIQVKKGDVEISAETKLLGAEVF